MIPVPKGAELDKAFLSLCPECMRREALNAEEWEVEQALLLQTIDNWLWGTLNLYLRSLFLIWFCLLCLWWWWDVMKWWENVFSWCSVAREGWNFPKPVTRTKITQKWKLSWFQGVLQNILFHFLCTAMLGKVWNQVTKILLNFWGLAELKKTHLRNFYGLEKCYKWRLLNYGGC